ncbi:hypothetical protein ACHWQZ_G002321 [Mnemiopsis leidyi]
MTVNVFPPSTLILLTTAVIMVAYFPSESPTTKTTSTSNPTTASVVTTCGTVHGKISETSRKKEILEFFNIPFAAPPVDSGRFRPPEIYNKARQWNSDVDGTKYREIVCPQPSPQNGTAIGTEDCLYLTVRTTDLSAAKSVIVWIHGGRFIHGYCCQPGYSFDNDLTETLEAVTVNINYRLGFLGFSSISELWDKEKGEYANNGIRDQIAALQWIQENISQFGGDPNSVTIIGESAGGTSVLALLSSPLAAGLFRQAVALSPGPEQRFNHKHGDFFQKHAWNVLENVGCDKVDDIRECLVKVPARDLLQKEGSIVKNQGKLSPSRLAYFRFPRSQGLSQDIGGYIITDLTVFPQNLRHLRNAKNIDPGYKVKVIVSNTAQETYCTVRKNPHLAVTSHEAVHKTLSVLFPKITSDSKIMDKVAELYGHLSPQFLWDTLLTDMRSTCPTNEVTEAMSISKHHDVYRLFIDYNMEIPDRIPAYHVFDTDVLFGFVGFDRSTLDKRDWTLRAILIQILKDFSRGITRNGWKEFPESTMVLGNDENIASIFTDRPHMRNCEVLQKANLTKYGWQN